MSRSLSLFLFSLILLGLLGCSIASAQDEPPLPKGLESEERSSAGEPDLPPGLSSPGKDAEGEPALPMGLGEESTPAKLKAVEPKAQGLPLDLSGFWEARLGMRVREDRYEKDLSIGETRLQLETERTWGKTGAKITADLLYDAIPNDHTLRLEEGRGFVDLREASLVFSPASFMDVKAGRQILTWGTGDLIFINDLFPKDWNSFFIGRDEEYLKAPSDAIKASLFNDLANIDLIYTPKFDSDRFIDGGRISYYNNSLGRLAGRDAIVETEKPDNWLNDSEMAVRFYRNLKGYELALYGYRGFWKSPAGTDPLTGKSLFPDLIVYGASARGGILRGIGNIEFGYYDSEDDQTGSDPLLRNSEFRFLVGYEQEVAQDFTMGLQYYLEHIADYGEYIRTLPAGAPPADEDRQVITIRLTKMLMNQNLKLSLFTYYSPSDVDAYLRPKAHYKIDDHWSIEAGGNLFTGEDEHTFFGQFKENTNVYSGIRYGF